MQFLFLYGRNFQNCKGCLESQYFANQTQNMTTECSLNYLFNTCSVHAILLQIVLTNQSVKNKNKTIRTMHLTKIGEHTSIYQIDNEDRTQSLYKKVL